MIFCSVWTTLGLAQPLDALGPAARHFVAHDATHFHIRDVQLIDGTGTPAQPGISVVVQDGLIAAVAPTESIGEVPGATVIEGAGHTLMPGLVMLHEHMFSPAGVGLAIHYNTNENSFPLLYLAGGVTTMRTAGSLNPYIDLHIAQDIEAGIIPGPHMDVTGPYLEGPGAQVRAQPRLATPEQARAFVNLWADAGATSFKAVYEPRPRYPRRGD